MPGGITHQASRNDGQTGSGVVYEAHTPAFGWLGAVRKADDSEDGYAGWMDSPIDGVRAYREDGAPLTIDAHMTDGKWCAPTIFAGSFFGENSNKDGYAGNINSGHFIDGIRASGAEIRVACMGKSYFAWLREGITSEGDGYAGEDLAKKDPIVAIQMRIS